MILRNLIVRSVTFLFLSLPVGSEAADYFVSATDGNDDNDGLSAGHAWETLAKAGHADLRPGDTVSLKRGDSWEEQLDIQVSGSVLSPIVFGAYGSGPKPQIKTSNTFNDWKLVVDLPEARIWQGQIAQVRNSFMAVQNDVRLPSYLGFKGKKPEYPYNAPDKLEDMQDGFFFAPLNKSRFYVRLDSGNPGEMEIGARPFGITIRDQAHVTIRSIDFFGGNGSGKKKSATGAAHILVDHSSHIRLLDISSRNHGSAIRIVNDSRDNLISGLKAYGHSSTAVYFWEAGPRNVIENSDLVRSGDVQTDRGDRGLVGVFKSPKTTVRNCRLGNNGFPGAISLDGAISYVVSPDGKITGNTITNAGGTGIQVAVDSDNCVIKKNTINGWCVYGASIKPNNHCEGIRIGGGPRKAQSSVQNCKISQNVIINRNDTGKNRAALKIMDRPTKGLVVQHNNITVSSGTLAVYAEGPQAADEWLFRDNTYQVEGRQGVIYRLGEKIFRAWEIQADNLGAIHARYGLELGSSVIITAQPGD